MAEQDIPPPIITAMKIPIIRKGEYDIWSMRMHQYICHTDHNLWDVIVNEDLEEEPAPTTGETSAPPAPKTAKQLAARRNQERVKSILLLAIPDEYLLKFHNVADAKSLWEAIKSRFGGNVESKKMQKNVLKHQFENFSTTSNESLDKAYDRFQKLISQLEVHGAPMSKRDINQKFLRSLPSSWNQIALIMRNKPDIDEIDIDDLYNNLRVYEDELKRSSGSNSASQNLAFLSSKNIGSTNEVSTASGDFRVSTAGGINQVPSTPCAHDIAYSFLAQPTTSPQLENEDFQKGHFARECRSGRSQGRRSYGDNGRNNVPTNESSSQALVAQDGLGGYDWSNDFEVEPVNYALMAISSSSSSSSSDSEVQKCSKQCLESFKTLQKNYDTEREKHNKAKLEIRGYEIALESLESRIIGHEKNELAWGEKYEFQNYELKCREIKINNLNLELEKGIKRVVKERMKLTTQGTTNAATIVKPKSVNEIVVSKSKINRNEVIIEDWTSYDEDDVCADKIISSVRSQADKSGQISQKQGIDFKKNIVPSGGLEKQLNHNVKIIRCDNGTEFKNYVMNEFYAKKGIKREFSVARTHIIMSEAGIQQKDPKRVEENLHINFLEDQPKLQELVKLDVFSSEEKLMGPTQEYILLPLQHHSDKISTLTGNSTTVACQFLGRSLISWRCKEADICGNFSQCGRYVADVIAVGKCIKGIHNLSDAELYAGISHIGSMFTEYWWDGRGRLMEEAKSSPTILEAAKTLSKVASQGVSKEKSTDKGKRYRRRARSMAKKIDTDWMLKKSLNTGGRRD
ncbi:ribonuclease H-like domain-containing protein [Tanacetum coccineum]